MTTFSYSPAADLSSNAAQLAAPKAPKGGFFAVDVSFEWDSFRVARKATMASTWNGADNFGCTPDQTEYAIVSHSFTRNTRTGGTAASVEYVTAAIRACGFAADIRTSGDGVYALVLRSDLPAMVKALYTVGVKTLGAFDDKYEVNEYWQ